ncbi:MAG: dihydropteroate synthase [Candidatus Gastranaerophilales bacterium]|nr:dihydropteroate synthase [Candidatus Gastranaerophilales bacterium]
MKLIGENIHIISKRTKEAIEAKDSNYIKGYIQKMLDNNIDWIDLNIGPARKTQGMMLWLTNTVREMTDLPISFDTTNPEEMKAGLKSVKNASDCIINSISADKTRQDALLPLAREFGSNLIALTLSDATGIPKEADARLEIAFEIIEKTAESGIENEKIFLDPLVLPVAVDQSQALEALNAIRMFKESFDPQVQTTIGLSNVSNGCPKENRPLINLVFGVLAMGCGLDSAIVDGFDSKLTRINRMIEDKKAVTSVDELYLNLYNIMSEFGELEDISYNKDNAEEVEIYKTAEILLNKNIYSHNYLSI